MWKKRIDAILVSVFLLFAVSATAAGIPEKKPENWGAEQGDDIPLIDQGKEQIIDNAQAGATVFLYDVAEYIDFFFDDGRFTSVENESRATVKLALGYSRHDQLKLQPRLDVRLKLPKFSSRAQLIIEAAEDSDFNVDDAAVDDHSERDDGEGGELRAALRWFLKEGETGVYLETEPSYKLSDLQFIIRYRLRYLPDMRGTGVADVSIYFKTTATRQIRWNC